MPIDPTKVALLDPVLEWLDAGAPHSESKLGFNMGYTITHEGPDYAGNSCGTAVCIAGALMLFHGETYSPSLILHNAQQMLGITEDEGNDLFCPWDGIGPLEELTPAMAAGTIRQFIATGVIDWLANGAPVYKYEREEDEDLY